MPPAGKRKQAWKRADDDGSSRDDEGVSSPSAGKQKQAWKTADVDGSSITPSTGKQKQAWKTADDDGSSGDDEGVFRPSTRKQKQAWKTADDGDDEGVFRPSTRKRKRAWKAANNDGSGSQQKQRKWKSQQREKREPKRTRAAYSQGASLPAASLMAAMPKKTKVTQFDKKAMCPKRVANVLKNGRCRCQRHCYQPFTHSEVVSLRQAFHQLHHTEQSFLIQTMRTEAKKTTYSMNGHIVCVEALHNLIGTGSYVDIVGGGT